MYTESAFFFRLTSTPPNNNNNNNNNNEIPKQEIDKHPKSSSTAWSTLHTPCLQHQCHLHRDPRFVRTVPELCTYVLSVSSLPSDVHVLLLPVWYSCSGGATGFRASQCSKSATDRDRLRTVPELCTSVSSLPSDVHVLLLPVWYSCSGGATGSEVKILELRMTVTDCDVMF